MEYSREEAVAAGKKAVAAGDTQAANEIASYLDSMELDTFPSVTGAISKATDAVKAGIPQIKADLTEAFDPTKTSMPLQQVADLTRAGGSAIGTGISAVAGGIEGAWGNTKVGRALAPYGKAVVNAITQNPATQKALEAIEAGVKTWDEFFKDYPEYQGLVEDSMLVAATAAPLKTPLKKQGTKQVTKGTAGKQLQRKQDIINKMEPVVPDTDLGDYAEVGFLNSRNFTPKDSLDDVYNQLDLTVKFDPKKSYNYNQNVVRARISQSAEQLREALKTEGNVRVDIDGLLGEFDEILVDLDKLAGKKYLTGDAAVVARSIIDEVLEALPKRPTTTQILDARQALDARLKAARKASSVFNPELESGLSIAAREVRQALNDAIHAKSKTSYGLLEEQHLLYRGLDRLDEGMKLEARTGPGRLVENVLPAGMHVPTTPLALGATAAAAASISPKAAGIGAGVLGAGYAANKLYKSRHGARQAIGRILRDKSITKTERMALVDAIRGDMQNLPEEDPQGAPQADIEKIMKANQTFSEKDAKEYIEYLKGIGEYN